MGVSIYYMASRAEPLTAEEQVAIKALIAAYSVDDQIDAYIRTGKGYSGEGFCVYDPADPSEPDVVFEGTTKLPSDSDEEAWHGLRLWCDLLSLIRRVLSTAAWHVHVDDLDLAWDEQEQHYITRA